MPIKDNFDEGCNEAKCKTCLFGSTPIELSSQRWAEIITYLHQGTRHICHVTNKTCYGALEFQARTFHAMKILPLPTVECLLEHAAKYKPIIEPK